jgi:hypothetical protein
MLANAEINTLACAEINKFSPYGGVDGFDVDFNILTAFIRLGRARPDRGGVPSIFTDFVTSNPVWFRVLNLFYSLV